MPAISSSVNEFTRDRGMCFSIGGKKIPAVEVLDSFKYLGHHYSASGVLKPNLSNLQFWVDNVIRSPLKPRQKMEIINNFLILKMFYSLQNYSVNARILRDADQIIKRAVKYVRHIYTYTGCISLRQDP
mgnify:CR=1 FL=1